ncbi:MAG: protein kinase [Bacteroidales bacterium]|nr:MAG: protein kinase [Bacteroidales bacterium]
MIGKVISQYKIIEEIGHGGMGKVYKAKDTRLNRFVALKFLARELTEDAEAKERFIREAQAASSLDHPNICTIHEINETKDGQIFICMAYYDAETLRIKVKNGLLSFEEAINITRQICQGLTAAHHHGLVHRDIKPANILITREGIVKIVDFGLAKLSGHASITKDHTLLGTVAYLSPEHASGEEADEKSDIWAVGIILYEILTRQLPFKGDIDQVLIYSILHDAPVPPTSVNPLIPKELELVIAKALQKDPLKRYQNIEQMEKDLRKIESKDTVDGTKITKIESRKPFFIKAKKPGIAIFLLVFLFLAFFIIKQGIQKKSGDIKPIPVAVIGFENMTGNEAYDYLQEAIPNLLITSLEQSPFLYVTTWERMHDLLEQINKKDIDFINKEIGFELCHLEGINVIVTGSYVKADNLFVTDVKVLDVTTKEIIKSVTSQGEGVTSILSNQINNLSKEIAQAIGLSRTKVKSAQIELAEVTTTSMEAYRFFLYGREKFEKSYWEDALYFLRKSIELDSTFSMAYLYLALTCEMLYYDEESWQALENAKKYSYRATEKERLYIEEGYYRYDAENRYRILIELAEKYPKEKRVQCKLGEYYLGMKMLDKAITTLNTAIDLDPGYGSALELLARAYMDSGAFDLAVEIQKKYTNISPDDAEPLVGLGDIYFRLGKLNDAIANYKSAIQIKPVFYYAYLKISYCYGLMEDYSEAGEWISKYKQLIQPHVPLSGEAIWWTAYYQQWLGQFEIALNTLEEALNLGREFTVPWGSAIVEFLVGYCNYEQNDLKTSYRYFNNAFKVFMSDNPLPFLLFYDFYRGIIELKQEQIDSVHLRLNEMQSLLPEFKSKHLWLEEQAKNLYNILKVEVLLKENQVQQAISVAKEISPKKIPFVPSLEFIFYNLPPYKDILARAYQQAGELDKAIREYEKLMYFNPASKNRQLIHPLYHYRLAMLYHKKGLTDKALRQYSIFLEQWKDADKDLPELIEAEKNYALLSAK